MINGEEDRPFVRSMPLGKRPSQQASSSSERDKTAEAAHVCPTNAGHKPTQYDVVPWLRNAYPMCFPRFIPASQHVCVDGVMIKVSSTN
jgi:hypothetical protein